MHVVSIFCSRRIGDWDSEPKFYVLAFLIHQFDKLTDPQVWLEAATQIFYSLGVAFGSLIAMSSYNDVNNNCKRDAILVSTINCGTSIFASIVIFSILGFKVQVTFSDFSFSYNGNSLLSGVMKPINEAL